MILDIEEVIACFIVYREILQLKEASAKKHEITEINHSCLSTYIRLYLLYSISNQENLAKEMLNQFLYLQNNMPSNSGSIDSSYTHETIFFENRKYTQEDLIFAENNVLLLNDVYVDAGYKFAYIILAKIQYQLGKFDDAFKTIDNLINKLDKILRKKTDNSYLFALYTRAKIYLGLEKYHKVLMDCLECRALCKELGINLKETMVDSINQLITTTATKLLNNIYERMTEDKPDEMIATLEKTLTFSSIIPKIHHVFFLEQLASLYLRNKKNYKRAIRYYNNALGVDPCSEYNELHILLGLAYIYNNEEKLSLGAFAEGIKKISTLDLSKDRKGYANRFVSIINEAFAVIWQSKKFNHLLQFTNLILTFPFKSLKLPPDLIQVFQFARADAYLRLNKITSARIEFDKIPINSVSWMVKKNRAALLAEISNEEKRQFAKKTPLLLVEEKEVVEDIPTTQKKLIPKKKNKPNRKKKSKAEPLEKKNNPIKEVKESQKNEPTPSEVKINVEKDVDQYKEEEQKKYEYRFEMAENNVVRLQEESKQLLEDLTKVKDHLNAENVKELHPQIKYLREKTKIHFEMIDELMNELLALNDRPLNLEGTKIYHSAKDLIDLAKDINNRAYDLYKEKLEKKEVKIEEALSPPMIPVSTSESLFKKLFQSIGVKNVNVFSLAEGCVGVAKILSHRVYELYQGRSEEKDAKQLCSDADNRFKQFFVTHLFPNSSNENPLTKYEKKVPFKTELEWYAAWNKKVVALGAQPMLRCSGVTLALARFYDQKIHSEVKLSDIDFVIDASENYQKIIDELREFHFKPTLSSPNPYFETLTSTRKKEDGSEIIYQITIIKSKEYRSPNPSILKRQCMMLQTDQDQKKEKDLLISVDSDHSMIVLEPEVGFKEIFSKQRFETDFPDLKDQHLSKFIDRTIKDREFCSTMFEIQETGEQATKILENYAWLKDYFRGRYQNPYLQNSCYIEIAALIASQNWKKPSGLLALQAFFAVVLEYHYTLQPIASEVWDISAKNLLNLIQRALEDNVIKNTKELSAKLVALIRYGMDRIDNLAHHQVFNFFPQVVYRGDHHKEILFEEVRYRIDFINQLSSQSVQKGPPKAGVGSPAKLGMFGGTIVPPSLSSSPSLSLSY